MHKRLRDGCLMVAALSMAACMGSARFEHPEMRPFRRLIRAQLCGEQVIAIVLSRLLPRFRDGWIPFEVSDNQARATRTAPLEVGTGLLERITLFRKLCAESGRRASLDVSLVRTNWNSWTVRSRQQVRDELAELQAMGVTWIVTTLATNEETEFARRLDTLRTLVL